MITEVLESDYIQTIESLKKELDEAKSKSIDLGVELLYATKEAEKLKNLVGAILFECARFAGTKGFEGFNKITCLVNRELSKDNNRAGFFPEK